MKTQIDKYELEHLLEHIKNMRDCLIDAPTDFLGTGSNSAAADKESAEWYAKWQSSYISAEALIEKYIKK